MLSKLNSLFDFSMKYFFINSKGNLLVQTANTIDEQMGNRFENHLTTRVLKAKNNYSEQIKKNGPLSFLASFFVGTEAYAARLSYLTGLVELHHQIETNVDKMQYAKSSAKISLTPFYFLHGLVSKFEKIKESDLSLNQSETELLTENARLVNQEEIIVNKREKKAVSNFNPVSWSPLSESEILNQFSIFTEAPTEKKSNSTYVDLDPQNESIVLH